MRNIKNRPKNKLGLDFEENLEGFIQILNWISIFSYTPVVTVMAGVMLRGVRPRVASGIFATLVTLNWASARWLRHRFLKPDKQGEHRIAGRF
jgi:hypothetical protein